jgi:hypothetical protein
VYQAVIDDSHLVLLGHNYEYGYSQLAVFNFGLIHPFCQKHQLKMKSHHKLSGYINFKELSYFPLHDEEPISMGNIPSVFDESKGKIHISSPERHTFWKLLAATSASALLFLILKDLTVIFINPNQGVKTF